MKKINLFATVMIMFVILTSSLVFADEPTAPEKIPEATETLETNISPITTAILNATDTISTIDQSTKLNLTDINTLIWVKLQQEQTIKFLKSQYISLEQRYSSIISILNQLVELEDQKVIKTNLNQIINAYFQDKVKKQPVK